jgi:hypothetical protein
VSVPRTPTALATMLQVPGIVCSIVPAVTVQDSRGPGLKPDSSPGQDPSLWPTLFPLQAAHTPVCNDRGSSCLW